jgi:Replication-relaxation
MIAMRSWESAAPAFACLTPRDRVLLRLLCELRYLTCEQAHRTCFGGLALPSVRARLGELKRRGLLRRLRREALSDRRSFWGLAPLGRAAAGALEAGDSGAGHGPATARPAAMAALQLEHLIGTNELFCVLWGMRRAGRLPPLRWLAGHRAATDLGHTRLVPDAVILIAGPAEWWSYYVERDRGTMPLQAIREKLDRYRLLFTAAAAQRDDPAWHHRADAWLLFACDDVRRALRIATVAAEAGLERVWAGLANGCPAGIGASLDGVPRPSEQPALPAWASGALVVGDLNMVSEEEMR